MSREKMLWIVDPAVAHAEHQAIAELAERWPGAHRVFRPAMVPSDGPGSDTGYDADAVIVLGSRASVHDELPWIERLAAWVAPLVDGSRPLPLLGICFGHQLIGHLAGAPVGLLAPDGAKRAGIETSYLEGGSLLPGSVAMPVVVSHREEVKSAPAGFRTVARRPGVLVDGLEHEHLPVFSFQFHPEAREEFAAYAGIPVARIDERVKRENGRLLQAFCDRAADTARS